MIFQLQFRYHHSQKAYFILFLEIGRIPTSHDKRILSPYSMHPLCHMTIKGRDCKKLVIGRTTHAWLYWYYYQNYSKKKSYD